MSTTFPDVTKQKKCGLNYLYLLSRYRQTPTPKYTEKSPHQKTGVSVQLYSLGAC